MSTNVMTPRRFSYRWFYLWVALASILIIFAGFVRTYYLRPLFGFAALPALLHLHGLVMTLWFVLFLVQVSLIERHRTDLHRRLGVLGAVLATAMVVVTATVVIRAAKRHITAFPETVGWPGFLLVSLGAVLTFALLFCGAIWFRRTSEVHKRLMALATISIWGPAIARLPLHFIQAGTAWTSIAIEDLCVLLFVAIDTIWKRRLHRAFLWGGLLIFASDPLLIWIGNTAVWARIAAWLLR